MALRATYLADKSALARFPIPSVEARLRPLVEEGLVATCAIVDLEALYSARTMVDYEALLLEQRSLESAPVTPEVMEVAIELQRALAHRGRHRVSIPDLVISACAQRAGLTVMHYDADFERIADAGGADHEWVVPRGSV